MFPFVSGPEKMEIHQMEQNSVKVSYLKCFVIRAEVLKGISQA